MDKTDTKTFQHFKFTLPILKTRVAVVKDADGNDIEKRYVEGVASSTDLDLHGDRMDPSAIKTMAESLKYHVVRLNAEHDTSWQSELGDISKLNVSEDSRLLIEAELNDMSKSHDLWYALTDLNKKLGLSIGGYVKDYENVKEESTNEETGEVESKWVRHYKNIELDHIAVTSSPANPKTWVGAIAKSIQKDSEVLIKKLEAKEEEKVENKAQKLETKKEKKLRDVARNIARAIQDLEADLLLELTYAGLNILNESQIELLDTLLIERSLPNMKKDVSLEAEEAKKADTVAEPEGEAVETPATPENESKEETPKTEETKAEEPKAEEPVVEEAEVTEEGKAEETPVAPTEEKSEERPAEESESEESTEETPKVEEEKSEESSGKEESEKEVETKSPEGKPESVEETLEEKPEEKAEVKSTTDEAAELLKSIQSLTDGMKKVLENNETLSKRIEELENQPASRKTIEIEKGLGDDDTDVIDSKSLKEEMEEKIAETRKNNYGNPNLFAMTQKIRAEYAKKVRG